MARLLYYCRCLFDASIELHDMNKRKYSTTFSLEKESGFSMLKRIIHILVHAVEAFITVIEKLNITIGVHFLAYR